MLVELTITSKRGVYFLLIFIDPFLHWAQTCIELCSDVDYFFSKLLSPSTKRDRLIGMENRKLSKISYRKLVLKLLKIFLHILTRFLKRTTTNSRDTRGRNQGLERKLKNWSLLLIGNCAYVLFVHYWKHSACIQILYRDLCLRTTSARVLLGCILFVATDLYMITECSFVNPTTRLIYPMVLRLYYRVLLLARLCRGLADNCSNFGELMEGRKEGISRKTRSDI